MKVDQDSVHNLFVSTRKRTAKRLRDYRRDSQTLARLFRKQGELLRVCVNARKALEQENNILRNHLNPKA